MSRRAACLSSCWAEGAVRVVSTWLYSSLLTKMEERDINRARKEASCPTCTGEKGDDSRNITWSEELLMCHKSVFLPDRGCRPVSVFDTDRPHC